MAQMKSIMLKEHAAYYTQAYLRVSCSEFSTERVIDLKNPWTAEHAYAIIGTSVVGEDGNGSPDLLATS